MNSVGCSKEEHLAIKTRVEYFMLETRDHCEWVDHGLLVGNCTECRSTLALHICKLCKEACPTTDELAWGNPVDDVYVHAACAIRLTLAANRVKFVLAAGRLG